MYNCLAIDNILEYFQEKLLLVLDKLNLLSFAKEKIFSYLLYAKH